MGVWACCDHLRELGVLSAHNCSASSQINSPNFDTTTCGTDSCDNADCFEPTCASFNHTCDDKSVALPSPEQIGCGLAATTCENSACCQFTCSSTNHDCASNSKVNRTEFENAQCENVACTDSECCESTCKSQEHKCSGTNQTLVDNPGNRTCDATNCTDGECCIEVVKDNGARQKFGLTSFLIVSAVLTFAQMI